MRTYETHKIEYTKDRRIAARLHTYRGETRVALERVGLGGLASPEGITQEEGRTVRILRQPAGDYSAAVAFGSMGVALIGYGADAASALRALKDAVAAQPAPRELIEA